MYKSKNSIFKIIVAGGGTGGHLFPGIAVVRELERRVESPKILFVIGGKKVETEILSRYGYSVDSISVEGIKGRGIIKSISVMFRLPFSIIQSISIIRDFSPTLVLGMGGYSAGPVCVAAKLLGIPTAIHEQNSYPGLTNRLLSRIVDNVFLSFEESKKYLKSKCVQITGNPVRKELLSTSNGIKKETNKFGVLVLGGSQGAKTINRVFVEALSLLHSKGFYPVVVHQTGQMDYRNVVAEYGKRKLKETQVAFIEDMKEAYNQADLVVSRAGATTIFELAAMGKPSILIPYPHATNHHQEINAQSLTKSGGAEMILEDELSAQYLATIIMKYMESPRKRITMGIKAKEMSCPDAAKSMVDKLIGLANRL